jgi:dTDP-4-amino-4,6-dideoxyglucose
MAIVKSSPGDLAIHGGGPPAFASPLSVFTAGVGDGHRFAELAERMFMASEAQGRLVEEFEAAVADWIGVRNVIGFSSLPAATRCLSGSQQTDQKILLPSFGASRFVFAQHPIYLECESARYGISPIALADQIREDAAAVFAANVLGRPCMIEEIEDLCDEWNIPLFLYGHQSFGCKWEGERLGSFGRAEIFDLGRDQLVHAMDAAIVTTDDDLLAYRLRAARSNRLEGIDQSMSDAAAAMGLANLEAADNFVAANQARYGVYREKLQDVPGIKLVRHDEGSTFQSIAIEVDARLSGITRNSLCDVLTAENVGVAKPFDAMAASSTPVAYRLASTLLQLPAGPSATDEVIAAVCKLVELAIIRSLEAPDPMQIAA